MKILFVALMVSASLMAFEQKIELGVDGIAYSEYANEVAVDGTLALAFTNEYFETNAKMEFLYSAEYSERRYFLLNEFYITKEFDEYALNFGKEVKYWGELEGYNIADIYNQKNYLKDPFDKDAKLGSIGIEISRYFQENSLSFGAKFYEQDIPYPEKQTPYAPLPLKYNKELQLSDKQSTPTFYVVANLLNDAFMESETKIILLRGYDSKRYFTSVSSITLEQFAYRVNKALFLSHVIYEDMIFKTEMAYTNVIQDKTMSDYSQLSFGVEKSFYEIFGSDLTLYGEYYRYLYADDTKRKNVDISEVYDNDLFVAMRVDFNDVRGSELKFGLLEDLQKDERIIKARFHTRVVDSVVIHAEYLHITSNTTNTLLEKFANSSRFSLGIEYTF